MRFLFDQSTDRRLVALLGRAGGHDITVIAVDYPPSLADEQVLEIAVREQRVLITEDRDFGDLIFHAGLTHAGVIYLRLPPMTIEGKWSRLDTALTRVTSDFNQFIVVTPKSVRLRRSAQ